MGGERLETSTAYRGGFFPVFRPSVTFSMQNEEEEEEREQGIRRPGDIQEPHKPWARIPQLPVAWNKQVPRNT